MAKNKKIQAEGREINIILNNQQEYISLLIQQGVSQSQRLIHLNKTAITQMKSLLENRTIKNLK